MTYGNNCVNGLLTPFRRTRDFNRIPELLCARGDVRILPDGSPGPEDAEVSLVEEVHNQTAIGESSMGWAVQHGCFLPVTQPNVT